MQEEAYIFVHVSVATGMHESDVTSHVLAFVSGVFLRSKQKFSILSFLRLYFAAHRPSLMFRMQ